MRTKGASLLLDVVLGTLAFRMSARCLQKMIAGNSLLFDKLKRARDCLFPFFVVLGFCVATSDFRGFGVFEKCRILFANVSDAWDLMSAVLCSVVAAKEVSCSAEEILTHGNA